MAHILQNFASALTANSIAVSDTTITVGSTASLPTLAAGDYLYMVITSATDLTKREIIKVTAISGTTLTVTRAQEGTTALAFPVGSLLEQRGTAQTIKDAVSIARGNYNGIMALGSSITLTKEHIGKLIAIGGGNTITLPSADTLQMGDTFTLVASDGTGLINCVGSDYLYISNVNKPTSITLNLGETLILTKWGGTGIWLVQGTALLKYYSQFGSALTTNGYQKLPSGLILQWGLASVYMAAANTLYSTAITLPMAFPNAILHATTSSANCSGVYQNCSPESKTKTGFNLITIAGAGGITYNVNWTAIGY